MRAGGHGTLHAWIRFGAKLTLPCHDSPPATVSTPTGDGGKGRRRAHLLSLISVHVGVGQRDRALDKESPAILQIMSTRDIPARGHARAGAVEESLQSVQTENTCPPQGQTENTCPSSGNVQPNQLDRTTRPNIEDPAPFLCIEHHTSWHLRFDGHGTVDAECRSAPT